MPDKQSRPIRNANRLLNDRLWDETGREWQRVELDLSRDRAEQLLTNPAVRVGVHDDLGLPLRWVDSDGKQSFWRNQVEPEFDPQLQKRRGRLSRHRYAKLGRLFAGVSLWKRGDEELLIFAWD